MGWQPNGPGTWTYYEITPKPSPLFGGNQYLEYAESTFKVQYPSATSNCAGRLAYRYKAGEDWTSVEGDYAWNSMDGGESVLLSTKDLTCHYQRVRGANCRSMVKNIHTVFRGEGIEIDRMPSLNVLCGRYVTSHFSVLCYADPITQWGVTKFVVCKIVGRSEENLAAESKTVT